MLDQLLSMALGGGTGVLGTAVSAVADYFNGRAEHQRQIDLRRLDIEAASVRGEAALGASRLEADARMREASYREAGQRWSDGQGTLMRVVDATRGLIRPILTVGLVGCTVLFYFHQPADRGAIVHSVLYLATASVLWWFGGRQLTKRKMQ